VRVLEHRPTALLRSSGTLYYLDQDGALITGADDPSGWMIVDASSPRAIGAAGRPLDSPRERASRRRALELVALLDSDARPLWAGRLLGIEIVGEDDYRLAVEGLPFALVVRTETAQERMVLFDQLRRPLGTELEAIEAVDLRFSGRIVLRPTAVGYAAGRTSEG
jgi:hypothetical protein